MWLEQGDFDCRFCLSEGAVLLRFDRRGRPYTLCRDCGARTFLHTSAGMAGLALIEPLVAELNTPERKEKLQQYRALSEQLCECQIPCMDCVTGTAIFKKTKKGLPFTYCAACKSRTFHGTLTLPGIMFFRPVIRSMVERMREDELYLEDVRERHQAMVRRMMSLHTSPMREGEFLPVTSADQISNGQHISEAV